MSGVPNGVDGNLRPAEQAPHLIKFGVFELDLQTGELRKQGHRIRLQEQPFRLLAAVLEHPGEVVTREDLARKLWPGNTQVDFDNGLNIAARKLRQALGDDADTPRYLETVPRRGYRFIGVLSNAHVSLPQVIDEPAAAALRRIRGWRVLAVATAGMIVLVLLGFGLAFSLRAPRVLRVVQLTRTGHAEVGGGIATDGARVYFTERTGGVWRIAQVSVAGGSPVPLPANLGDPDLLAVSPKRSELLVADYDGLEGDAPLYILPITGGESRRVPGVRTHAATFSRDGSSIIFARAASLFRVNRDGSGLRKLVDTPGFADAIRWAPAGAALTVSLLGKEGAKALWTYWPDAGNLHPLMSARIWPVEWPRYADVADWTPDGRYVVFRSLEEAAVSAWALRVRPGLLHWFDRPVQIYATPLRFGALAPSPDGRTVFLAAGQERRETLSYDAKQRQFVPFLAGIPARWINFSRDGRWVSYVTIPEGDLWRARGDGSQPKQLTLPPLHALEPHWSPDGRWIAFHGGPTASDQVKVYVAPADGGTAESITPEAYNDSSPSWSSDGQSLMFHREPRAGRTGQTGIFVMDLRTREAVLLPGSETWQRPVWSPDSQYVAAMDPNHIVCFDFQTRGWTQLAQSRGFSTPFWSGDSKYIYYQELFGSAEQAIFRVRASTGAVERLMSSRQIPQAGLLGYTLTGMTPDDAPIATVLRSNFDVYALEMDLP